MEDTSYLTYNSNDIDFVNQEVKDCMSDKNEKQPLRIVPDHVAIIMDGNGRWAKSKGQKRTAGHQEGVEAIRRVTKTAAESGVKILTLYAFSTENWKRPPSEISFLMNLPIKFFDRLVPELMANNVRVTTIGSKKRVPSPTQNAINKVIDKTKDNDGMILNFAFNYGSRYEISMAAKRLSQDVLDGKVDVDDIDDKLFDDYLMTHQFSPYSDIDLLIRTSGEQRLSNFLLWQNAYSEFYFSPLNWPDFNEDTFYEILLDYQKRNRRYGGLTS